MDLRGKTALVSGGARRDGRAIAVALAGAGANLVIHDDAEQLDAEGTRDAIRSAGGEVRLVAGDLTRRDHVEHVVTSAIAAFGGVDILVNSAGIVPHTPVDTLSAAQWEHTLTVNVKGPCFLAIRLGRHMMDRGAGTIVNIADWAGVRPYRGYLAYCVSKAGVMAMTKGLATALAPDVRVNCVSPRPLFAAGPPTAAQTGPASPALRNGMGTSEAVARMVLFLATGGDGATGGIYVVDGGRLNA